MFSLTRQERQVILFLTGLAVAGLGINFCLKANSRLQRFVQARPEMAKININTTNLDDLAAIKTVSPKLARKIIEYRNTQGPFQSIEDLKEIKGIGTYRYEKLKAIFYVE